MQFKNASFVASYHTLSALPKTGYPEIAFAGRSNVGKSSLINKVLNRRKLAQVSKTPGKTRALNYFIVDNRYYFVDLPGFGYARIAKEERRSWGKLIDAYLSGSAYLKGIVHIIDSRRGLGEADYDLIDYLDRLNAELKKDLKVLWVLSKSDKLNNREKGETFKKVLDELECEPKQLIYFSAKNNQGVTEVKRLIMEILSK